MGKFKYSMQNILDIKIKLETQAKNEFSEANRAYLIEKEKLEELFKKRAVYEAALKEQLSGSLNSKIVYLCRRSEDWRHLSIKNERVHFILHSVCAVFVAMNSFTLNKAEYGNS